MKYFIYNKIYISFIYCNKKQKKSIVINFYFSILNLNDKNKFKQKIKIII